MSIHHLSFEDRVKIETYIHEGYNLSQISSMLGFSRAAITKELQRAVSDKTSLKYRMLQYDALHAQHYANNRISGKYRQFRKLNKSKEKLIYKRIKIDKWSPEQIANTEKRLEISTRTIYNWINKGAIHGISHKDLRRKGKFYKRSLSKRIRKSLQTNKSDKKTVIQEHNIENRPIPFTSRKHFGHWELDGVESRKSNTLLLTFVERKTRYAEVIKVDSKLSADIAHGISKFLNQYSDYVESITCDRGSEFVSISTRMAFESYNVKYYYAHAYSPYERGSNENFNGLLREYIPKGTNLKNVTDDELQQITNSINNRPMKLHRYRNRRTAFLRQIQYTIRYKKNRKKIFKQLHNE